MIVRMVHSVGDHVAGESYEVEEQEGNRWVVLGYAETEEPVLAFTAEERDAILATSQSVGV